VARLCEVYTNTQTTNTENKWHACVRCTRTHKPPTRKTSGTPVWGAHERTNHQHGKQNDMCECV